MTTLTIQIVTGSGWYQKQVGKRYEVTNHDDRYFSGLLNSNAKIDKNHAIVTAVRYDTAEKERTQWTE